MKKSIESRIEVIFVFFLWIFGISFPVTPCSEGPPPATGSDAELPKAPKASTALVVSRHGRMVSWRLIKSQR